MLVVGSNLYAIAGVTEEEMLLFVVCVKVDLGDLFSVEAICVKQASRGSEVFVEPVARGGQWLVTRRVPAQRVKLFK